MEVATCIVAQFLDGEITDTDPGRDRARSLTHSEASGRETARGSAAVAVDQVKTLVKASLSSRAW